MSDEELLTAIRQIVREEVANAIKDKMQKNNQATKTLNKVKDILEDHHAQEENTIKSFLENYEIEVDENIKEAWLQLLELVKSKLSNPSFDTWFSGIELVANNNNKLIFLVENDFQADWLETRYLDMLEEAMKELTGEQFEFVFSPPAPELVEKIKKQ